MNNSFSPDSIILFNKKPGKTSFSSLYEIKRALNIKKVGHTGTLDSFACGLLVVCAGSLTKLAGHITQFDKTYKAVIEFGKETDTLEYTGNVVKETGLPRKKDVDKAIKHFTGEIMQQPPKFSAIRIDGKRASDAVRRGEEVEISDRKVVVYSAKILEYLYTEVCLDDNNDDAEVLAVMVEFVVSKGTYIRSLARDIGNYSNSCAHLVGLYRTKVGNFSIEDAVGYDGCFDFSIMSAYDEEKAFLEKSAISMNQSSMNEKFVLVENDNCIYNEILKKRKKMDLSLSRKCGFASIVLKKEYESSFKNGVKLMSRMFKTPVSEIKQKYASVFTEQGDFAGLLQKNESGYFKYAFVIN